MAQMAGKVRDFMMQILEDVKGKPSPRVSPIVIEPKKGWTLG